MSEKSKTFKNVPEEVLAVFDEFVNNKDAGFPDQAAAFTAMVRCYQNEQLKVSCPSQASNIEHVDGLLKQLKDAFVYGTELLQNAEVRATAQVQEKIKAQDDTIAELSQTNKDLRDALEQVQTTANQRVAAAEQSAAESANALIANAEQLSVAQQRTAELQGTVETQAQLIANLTAQAEAAKEIPGMREQIAQLQQQLTTAQADAATQRDRADGLEIKYNDFATETANAQAEYNAKLAVADEKSEQLAAELAAQKELAIKLKADADKYQEIGDSTAKQAAQVQSLLERQLAEYKATNDKREAELLARISRLEEENKSLREESFLKLQTEEELMPRRNNKGGR